MIDMSLNSVIIKPVRLITLVLIMRSWQLQEAKAKFSELVRKATFEGPQEVTVRGHEQVVVISKKHYDELLHPKLPFWDFMSNSPLKGIDLDLERDQSPPREISL